MNIEEYNIEHKAAIRFILGETLTSKELAGLNLGLLSTYLKSIKNNATLVIKQLKEY